MVVKRDPRMVAARVGTNLFAEAKRVIKRTLQKETLACDTFILKRLNIAGRLPPVLASNGIIMLYYRDSPLFAQYNRTR